MTVRNWTMKTVLALVVAAIGMMTAAPVAGQRGRGQNRVHEHQPADVRTIRRLANNDPGLVRLPVRGAGNEILLGARYGEINVARGQVSEILAQVGALLKQG